jgi:hypothetical protein
MVKVSHVAIYVLPEIRFMGGQVKATSALRNGAFVGVLGMLSIGIFADAVRAEGESEVSRVEIEEDSITPPGDRGPGGPGIEDGATAALRVELVPVAVLTRGSRETIEYHAELASDLDTDGAYAWTATLADDLGNMLGILARGEGRVATKGSDATGSFSQELADGFYAFGFRVAVSAKGRRETGSATQYVRVKNGIMRELTVDEWYMLSRARLAFDEKVTQ